MTADWREPLFIMVGDNRHPLLAQLPPKTSSQHPNSTLNATQRAYLGLPGSGATGVGVKLMQEPGFAAHDSHLYNRSAGGSDILFRDPNNGITSTTAAAYQQQERNRLQLQHQQFTANRMQYNFQHLSYDQQENIRTQKLISPGARSLQQSAAAAFFARYVSTKSK